MFHNDSIAGSWTALVERIESTHALGRWAGQDARLAGLHEVGRDVLPLLAQGADADRADQVLGALVGRAALDGGADDDALLLTVHLLSDWVLPQATDLGDLAPCMVAVIVSELTCQIRTYAWRHRTQAVAGSLKLDTRHAILAEFLPSTCLHRHRAELDLAPASGGWHAIELVEPVAGPDEDEEIDVADLLDWACRRGVDADGIALLVRVEQARADVEHPRTSGALADEFGLPRRTFFRHRARTLSALRTVGREYLAAVA